MKTAAMKSETTMRPENTVKADNKKKIRIIVLLIALLIPLFVGGFSAFLTARDMKLYGLMDHPPLSPPSWVFPIAWTILYLMMGLASYLVYTSDVDPQRKNKALLFYIAQLSMNLFWSTLFFTYRQYLVSLIWLLVMWGLIIITTIRFFLINRASGLMMAALLLWTTFAAYLNFGFYLMSLAG